MDPHRTDNTQTQGHSVYFRSLVCFRNQGDHCHFAENHSRFRRVSARIVSVQYPAPGDPALARRVQKLLAPIEVELDRKSTRLNSSHTVISYAVFRLKKK